MAGTLYLCATPIGNLEDMTFRVIRTLKEVDLIAAEDTRNSIKLLNHFEIKTPMTSYHEYNKIEKGHALVDKLLTGMNIALITDAGTPGISDPGEELVKMCYEAGITVTSLPGAAALPGAHGEHRGGSPVHGAHLGGDAVLVQDTDDLLAAVLLEHRRQLGAVQGGKHTNLLSKQGRLW